MNSIYTQPLHATTVIAVKHNGALVIGADGQASLGHTIAKSNVKKLRLLQGGKVVVGFAGSTADAFTLLDTFDKQLSAQRGDLMRGAVAFAKSWRTERHLRRLEAQMIAIDQTRMLLISGSGDVLEPDKEVVAIGSGSLYALSAALAMKKYGSNLTAQEIVENSLKIAADICIYTNHNIRTEQANPI